MAGSVTMREIKLCLAIARLVGNRVPKDCVETGTYQGDSAVELAKIFGKVHTIELSEKWYQYAQQRLESIDNITCHYGDSGEVLVDILPDFKEPVLVFLDAHYAGGDTAFGKDEVPLLRELNAICDRPTQDILVIDDLRLIGKSGECGGGPLYAKLKFDWRDITIEKLGSIAGNKVNSVFWFLRDRIIVFRNQSWLQRVMLNVLIPLANFITPFLGKANLTTDVN